MSAATAVKPPTAASPLNVFNRLVIYVDPIELFPAFHWVCEHCGELNFELPEAVEQTPEEAEQTFREIEDIEDWQELPDDWQDYQMFKHPTHVVCEYCYTEFEVAFDVGPPYRDGFDDFEADL